MAVTQITVAFHGHVGNVARLALLWMNVAILRMQLLKSHMWQCFRRIYAPLLTSGFLFFRQKTHQLFQLRSHQMTTAYLWGVWSSSGRRGRCHVHGGQLSAKASGGQTGRCLRPCGNFFDKVFSFCAPSGNLHKKLYHGWSSQPSPRSLRLKSLAMLLSFSYKERCVKSAARKRSIRRLFLCLPPLMRADVKQSAQVSAVRMQKWSVVCSNEFHKVFVDKITDRVIFVPTLNHMI